MFSICQGNRRSSSQNQGQQYSLTHQARTKALKRRVYARLVQTKKGKQMSVLFARL